MEGGLQLDLKSSDCSADYWLDGGTLVLHNRREHSVCEMYYWRTEAEQLECKLLWILNET